MKHNFFAFGVGCALAAVSAATFLGGCVVPTGPFAFSGLGPSAGDFGATQGGVQDMGLARQLVASGRVPPADAFVVEGMFSEHDLPLTGAECLRILCLRVAAGVAPTVDGASSGWMQIGLSSTIGLDAFVRPPLTLIATVDVSGSMGWEYATQQTEYPTPGQVSRNLLSAIAAKLNAADRIAIVTYGTDVHTVLDLTAGDQQVTIQAVIDALSTGGVTDMESGLRRAYEIAENAGGLTEQVRVMLFTDIQPNVGATGATEFEQIVERGASGSVGITVMGVGVGLRQELMNAMSHVRGGNAFSLFDNKDVTELMEDDWPWLVSPIAYAMSLEVTPSPGFEVADAYGFPAGEAETGLDVSTVFLSRRKGALLIRLTPTEGTDLTGMQVNGHLSYETPAGEMVNEDVAVAYNGEAVNERGHYFEQSSVGKAVALALLVSGMKTAAEQYATDPEAAIVTMTATLERFSADADDIGDEAISAEVKFAADLLQLMKDGAEQGDLYGYGYL